MFTPNLYRLEHLFVVRLWCEPGPAAAPAEWRGSVAHVPSGARLYFVALADLAEFIRLHMAAAERLPADES